MGLSVYDLGERRTVLLRIVHGKQLVDPSIVDDLSSDLKAFAEHRGVSQFKYNIYPFQKASLEPQKIENLNGSLLYRKLVEPSVLMGIMETSHLSIDPTANPFIYEGVLQIPALIFSEHNRTRDYKIPFLRSLEKSGSFGRDLKVTQKFYLLTEDLVQKCPDIAAIGRRVFGDLQDTGKRSIEFEKQISQLDLELDIEHVEKSMYTLKFIGAEDRFNFQEILKGEAKKKWPCSCLFKLQH